MDDHYRGPARRRWGGLPAAIAAASALLLAALAVATNQATALLPRDWAWLQSAWLWWALVAILTLAVVGLAVWQIRVPGGADGALGPDSGGIGTTAGSLVGRDLKGSVQRVSDVSGGTVIGQVRARHFTLNQPPSAIRATGDPSQGPTRSGDGDRLWNIPAPVRSFTDRDSLIATVSEQLRIGSGSSSVATLALYGMGGVGKTQVARAYAHRHFRHYTLGWWIPAETVALTEATLAELAVRLGARPDLSSAQLAAQLNVLLADRHNWLLVFDNSPNPPELQPFLPSVGGGHILITSRTRAWAGIAEPISVDLLALAAAVELLQVRTRDPDQDAARELAEELGRLSLALEQAAAYCAEYQLSLARYLELFRSRRAELLHRGQPLAYEGTVDTVYSLLVEQIDQINHAAVQLLQFCALLAPDAIPVTALLDHPQHLPQPLARAAQDALTRNDMLGTLYRTSLLTQETRDTARIHRLVRDVTFGHIGPSERLSLITRGIDLLVTLFPDTPGDLISRSACAGLVSHANAVIIHGYEQQESTLPFATLLDRVAYYLLVWTSDMESAGSLQEHALAIRVRIYPGDHPDTATSLNGLATTMRHMGRLQRSRELHEQALAMHRNVHLGDHSDTATTLTDLSFTCSRLGDGQAAFGYGEEALAMRRRLNPGDHMDTVVSLNDLSVALRQRGDPEHALVLNDEALAMARRLHDGDHPEIAQSLYELGVTHRQLGDLEQARTFAEQALAMRERLHPDEHRHTARSLRDVALTLHRLGDFTAAQTVFERSFAMRQRLHPGDHPETAQSLDDLGINERELGHQQRAAEWQRQAAAMRERLATQGLLKGRAWE